MNMKVLMNDIEDLIIEGEISTENIELNGYLDYRGPKGDKGEQGIQGPKGEQGPKGDKGEQGNDGTGVTILGSYKSLEELELAHPSGDLGDSYLINGYLYIWNEINKNWKNAGTIQGPKGDKGEQGVQGPKGEQGPKGDKGEQGIQGLKGEQGPKGDAGKAIDGDTLPIGGIIEYNGNIVPEGYEKIPDSYENVYSKSEKIIGEFLGCNLYRKVFSIDNQSCIFNIGNANDTCIIINKFGFIIYTLKSEPAQAFDGDDGFDISTNFFEGSISVTLGSGKSNGKGYLVVEYIKQSELIEV